MALIMGAVALAPVYGQDAEHAVKQGAKETAKVVKGTVKSFDKEAKTLTVKTADGTEETLKLSEKATVRTGKDVSKATEATFKEGEKVTVHYGGEGAHKVAHAIRRVV
ncbi:MAG: hypothetical protein ABI972_16755 [Acidobacteriota bacterium]